MILFVIFGLMIVVSIYFTTVFLLRSRFNNYNEKIKSEDDFSSILF